MERRKLNILIFLVQVFTSALFVLLMRYTSLEVVRLKFFDLLFVLRDFVLKTPPPSSDDIVVYFVKGGIGEVAETLQKAGKYGADIAVVDFLLKELSEEELRAFAEAIKENKKVIFASEISLGKINFPHPLLRLTAKTGYYNVLTDRDGIVRRVKTKLETEYYLGAKAFLERVKQNDNAEGEKNTRKSVDIPEVMYVNLRPNINKVEEIGENVRGKVLIIAPDPVEWRDILLVAYHSFFGLKDVPFSGAEFLASAYITLKSRDWVKFIGLGGELLLVSLCVVISGIGNFFGWRVIPGFLFGISLILTYFVLFLFIFIKFGFALPLSEIVLASAFQGVFGTAVRYRFVESKRRILEKFFKRYVNPEVLQKIAENPDSVKLGGDMIRATVMVIDIKGFTRMAERMRPDELVSFINSEFDWMTEKIVEHSGMVISYLGDAIFSIFGVPVERSDFGATDALRCAIDIFRLAGQRGLKIDIAISTGEVLVGNIGSRRKMEYTAMGDTVNTAFRMEAMCSSPNGEIVVSSDVIKNVKGEGEMIFHEAKLEEVGEIALRGKQKTTKILRVVLR